MHIGRAPASLRGRASRASTRRPAVVREPDEIRPSGLFVYTVRGEEIDDGELLWLDLPEHRAAEDRISRRVTRHSSRSSPRQPERVPPSTYVTDLPGPALAVCSTARPTRWRTSRTPRAFRTSARPNQLVRLLRPARPGARPRPLPGQARLRPDSARAAASAERRPQRANPGRPRRREVPRPHRLRRRLALRDRRPHPGERRSARRPRRRRARAGPLR